MKKLIIFITLIILSIFSFGRSVFSANIMSLETIEDYYISDIDFSYQDLDLSENEIDVIEKYQSEELRFGLYEVDGYYQEYKGSTLGDNYHIYKQLEKVFDLNITMDHQPFQIMMDNYNNGEYDVVPGLIITEDREDSFHFSEFTDVADVYLYSNEYIKVNNMSDLDGKVIAKQQGMKIVVDEYIQYLESIDINITLVDYENILDAVPQLGNEVDYIVHSKNVDLIQSGVSFIDAKLLFSTYDLHVTSRKSDDLITLLSAFDKAYEYQLKENLMAYRNSLSYLLFEDGIYFAEEEKELIISSGTDPIKVGSASNWIPYLYADDNGDLQGFAYDTFVTLTESIGLEYDFTFDESASWNDVLDDLGRDSNPIVYDVITADSVTNYEDDFIKYSLPIRSEEAYVVGLTNTPLVHSVFDLREHTVGIIPFYAATTYLEENIGLNDFKVYQSLDEIITALIDGEIEYFAVVKSEYEGMYYMDKHYNILPKYTIKDDFDIAIGFPMGGEDTDTLISIYNKAIVLSDRSEINDEYFNIQIDLSTVVLKRTINIVIISVILLALVVSSLVFLYIKKIRSFLLRDVLTNVKNRRALFNQTNFHSYNYLYYLDIDSFKNINDGFGHQVGDEILIKFCELIQSQLTGELYRLGGDEFIFLSLNEYNKDAFDLPPMRLPSLEDEKKITVSVGALNINDFDNVEIDELIILADTAMYKVKQSGKNEVQYLSKEMISEYKANKITYKARKESRL